MPHPSHFHVQIFMWFTRLVEMYTASATLRTFIPLSSNIILHTLGNWVLTDEIKCIGFFPTNGRQSHRTCSEVSPPFMQSSHSHRRRLWPVKYPASNPVLTTFWVYPLSYSKSRRRPTKSTKLGRSLVLPSWYLLPCCQELISIKTFL